MLTPRRKRAFRPLPELTCRRLRVWNEVCWVCDSWRRRSLTERRRASKRSPRMKGSATAAIVASVAANTTRMMMLLRLNPPPKSMPNCSMVRTLDFEVDHFAHDHNARAHHAESGEYQPVSGVGREKNRDVVRRDEAQDATDGERQGTDDAGRRFRFAR